MRLGLRGSLHKPAMPLRSRMNFAAKICTEEVAEMSLSYFSGSQRFWVHTFWTKGIAEFIKLCAALESTQ